MKKDIKITYKQQTKAIPYLQDYSAFIEQFKNYFTSLPKKKLNLCYIDKENDKMTAMIAEFIEFQGVNKNMVVFLQQEDDDGEEYEQSEEDKEEEEESEHEKQQEQIQKQDNSEQQQQNKQSQPQKQSSLQQQLNRNQDQKGDEDKFQDQDQQQQQDEKQKQQSSQKSKDESSSFKFQEQKQKQSEQNNEIKNHKQISLQEETQINEAEDHNNKDNNDNELDNDNNQDGEEEQEQQDMGEGEDMEGDEQNDNNGSEHNEIFSRAEIQEDCENISSDQEQKESEPEQTQIKQIKGPEFLDSIQDHSGPMPKDPSIIFPIQPQAQPQIKPESESKSKDELSSSFSHEQKQIIQLQNSREEQYDNLQYEVQECRSKYILQENERLKQEQRSKKNLNQNGMNQNEAYYLSHEQQQQLQPNYCSFCASNQKPIKYCAAFHHITTCEQCDLNWQLKPKKYQKKLYLPHIEEDTVMDSIEGSKSMIKFWCNFCGRSDNNMKKLHRLNACTLCNFKWEIVPRVRDVKEEILIEEIIKYQQSRKK